MTDGTTSLTFSELHDSALALAAGLHRLGIGPGDRVSVQLRAAERRGTYRDQLRSVP